jgi:hypothetical protein
MPRRRQPNVANHLPASRKLPPIGHIFILPSEALAGRLKNVEAISGAWGQGDAQGHTRRSVGGSKQGSARSGAIEKYRLDRGA